jgi:2-oxoglutarate ferredoxin oxidoreductase subunit alpha
LHDDFDRVERERAAAGPPFGHALADGVPPMPAFGGGRQLMVTGSTHDAQGFRKVDDPSVHDALVTRLMRKTMDHVDEIVEVEQYELDDAEIAFFAYGISARTAIAAVRRLRARGVKVGLLRALTLWPFPEQALGDLGKRIRALVVPELNKGMIATVARAFCAAPVHTVNQTNGKVLEPGLLVRRVEELSS